MTNFDRFFESVTGFRPRGWQSDFSKTEQCIDRLVPIGTGLGKTLGLATAWAYRRIVLADDAWPRRLVWCLPMRVLVEQTTDELINLMDAVGDVVGIQAPSVHKMMGGVQQEDWQLEIDQPAVFVGTQDMLLSRALNRGYGAGRGRWPIDFALLNQDSLWVFDEVQLQGVGAVTGSQLQAFRQQEFDAQRVLRPCRTWWASATLRSRWLSTVDSQAVIETASENQIEVAEDDKSAELFVAKKPLSIRVIEGKTSDKKTVTAIADLIAESHRSSKPENQGRVTLVVVNRVRDACELDTVLRKRDDLDNAEVCLIHSRFRGAQREQWRGGSGNDDSKKDTAWLSRSACEDLATNRIIVSTQVVEAGVDISASTLITENAPWASLVQRFGRAARYGGLAPVIVVDRDHSKVALPYEEEDLAVTLRALEQLSDVGLESLQHADQKWREDESFDQQLFRLDYTNVLLRQDLDELFDTSADLTGDDIDICRFIREGDDTNVSIAWYIPDSPSDESKRNSWSPPATFQPPREQICPAPIGEAKGWLFSPKTRALHIANCEARSFVFSWSYDQSRWLPVNSKDQIYPGQILLVDHRCGGYTNEAGFVGAMQKVSKKYTGVPDPIDFNDLQDLKPSKAQLSDRGQQLDPVSVTESEYVSIADHNLQAASEVAELGKRIGLNDQLIELLQCVGRWHDYGKCHPVFRGNIQTQDANWVVRDDIAKAPQEVWMSPLNRQYNHPEKNDWRADTPHGRRPGFRHELASMLGVLELVARTLPEHESVNAGDLSDLFEEVQRDPMPSSEVVQELSKHSKDDLNLVLYLIASHHGKVRCGMHLTADDESFRRPCSSSPEHLADQQHGGLAASERVSCIPVRGVLSGDELPPIEIALASGERVTLPPVGLHTDISEMGWSARYGESWTQRVQHLRTRIGIFSLAYLEAIFRAADVRVSK
ncbi:MAG: helicase-related protein [Pirellulaceae bacterium]